MAITLRLVKGSQLTFAEVDNNFKSLFYSSSLDGNTLNLYYHPGDTSQSIDLSSLSGGGSTDTGSLMVTGSVTNNVLTFTKGDGSTFDLTIDTGSIDTSSFVTNSQTGSFLISASATSNTLHFTASDASTFDVVIDTGSGGGTSLSVKYNDFSIVGTTDTLNFNPPLLPTSGLGQININLVTSSFVQNDQTSSFITNDQTSSFVTTSQTGSFLISASANLNTIHFTASDASTFDVTIDTGSVDTSNFITSTQTGSFLNSGSFNSGTNTLTLYSDDTNYLVDLSSLAGGGGSGILGIKYDGAVVTSSADMLNFNSPLSASNTGDQIEITINTGSFVQNDQTSSFVNNNQTSSFVTNSQTGSFLISASATSNILHFTASDASTFNVIIDTGSIDTSSFVTNSETGSFLYSGSFNPGTSALTLYSDDTNHIVDLSSLAGGGGSGILGIKYDGVVVTSSADMLNFNSPLSASNTEDQIEITINTGSFITNPQTGSYLVSASNSGGDAFQDITFTKGDGTTFTVDATPNHVHERVINKESGQLLKGTPVYVSGSTGNAVHVYAASASNASRMPAAFVIDTDLNSEQEGFGLVIGFINGVNTSQFNAGDSVYVGANGGYTNVRPTGSNILVQKLGNVINVDASNGSGVITGAGRANDVPNIQTGYLWVGDEDEVAVPIPTSSIQNVVSSSYALTASYAPNYVLNSATSSFVTNSQTGSFLISASADSNTIHFTASDASTFSVTVDTGSGGGGVTINNNTNNNLVTATGTSNTLDGEPSLTFDGGASVGNLRVTHSAYIQGGVDGELVVGGLHLNDASLYYNSIDFSKNGSSNHTDLVIVNIDNPATFSLAPNTGMDDGRVIIFRNWNTALGSTGELYVTTSMANTYFGLTNNNTYSSNFTMTGSTAATFLFLSGAYDPDGDGGNPAYDLFMQISGDTITTFN